MKTLKKYEGKPDYVVAPGKLIKEYLDYYSLTKENVAGGLGIGLKTFAGILEGEVQISCEIAKKLEEIIGITSDTWQVMDKRYWEQRGKLEK
jgi:plasmid maintenance system antidote protein VapI